MPSKITIYGKGKVGTAVAQLAQSLNLSYELTDDQDSNFVASRDEILIPSPGISPKNRAYTRKNTISELDFAFRYLPVGFKIIAITGTDGKSTTSWITYELLRQEFGEENVFLSGNFEIPFSETVRTIREQNLKKGYIVIEISSFMANGIGDHPEVVKSLPEGYRTEAFFADYTIFTNLETDHIDWHGSFESYFEAKMNLVAHTKKRVIAQESLKGKSEKFSKKFPKNTRWYGVGTLLKDTTDGENIRLSGRRKFRLTQTNLKGTFNAMNLLAAFCITNELKICSKRIATYLPTISGLPHRLECIGEIGGITYIDDSKSTSAQSLKVALESYIGKKVVLIAGGSDKGDTFDHLAPLFQNVVKTVICIGATRTTFAGVAEAAGIPYEYADSMKEAVAKAHQIAILGEVVLLSPGCASFGMFQNYLDRAKQFIEAVQSIQNPYDSIG